MVLLLSAALVVIGQVRSTYNAIESTIETTTATNSHSSNCIDFGLDAISIFKLALIELIGWELTNVYIFKTNIETKKQTESKI